MNFEVLNSAADVLERTADTLRTLTKHDPTPPDIYYGLRTVLLDLNTQHQELLTVFNTTGDTFLEDDAPNKP